MRKIILGTDWWTDCDDCVALRLLTNAHKNKEIELIGIGINACMEYSASSLNAFLTFDGVPDIPIGIDLNGTDFNGDYFKYQEPISKAYPHKIKDNYDCEDAVKLYKRLLSEAKEKVDIIEIGFNQVLAQILESENGIELFKEKVNKLYIMAGEWDKKIGQEHNFCNNLRSAMGGHILCRKCPVPITFVGFEVGKDILTGDSLSNDDILTVALEYYGCADTGRWSWDPMTALLAIIGDEEKAGYKKITGTASVNYKTGENRFTEGKGLHSYVIKTQPNEYYRNEIQKRL